MKILSATLKRGKDKENTVNASFDPLNSEGLLRTLDYILTEIKPTKEEIRNYKEAQLDIRIINKEAGEVEIDAKGDPGALFYLCHYLKSKIDSRQKLNDNLLDWVNISAEYAAKYSQWAREVAKKHKDLKPEEIPDEVASVDNEGNLIISINIKGENYSFKIPKEKWDF